MFLNEVYFWTDTIKDWKHILQSDRYKQLIIDVLTHLVNSKLIRLYAFVIMPNHLHFIWEPTSKNGKEMPHASFDKDTGHLLIRDLKTKQSRTLRNFEVKDKERQHRIWQRDPLAILMDGIRKVEQKLDYIHLNPLQEKWCLVKYPEDYKWSSAKFYETGEDEFGILTHYKDRF